MKFTKEQKRIVKKILEYSIYAIVGYFIYSKLGGNLEQIRNVEIDYPYLLAATLLFSTHNIWNGLNWDYLIERSGEQTKLDQQMRVYLKSYLMRYVPGNVVGIMGRAILNKPYGIPMFKSLWGWFFENIVYLALGIFIGSYAVLKTQFASYSVLGLMVVAFVVGLFILLRNDLLERVFEGKIAKKLPEAAKKEATPLRLSPKVRIEMLGRYTLSWIIYSLSFVLVVSSVIDLNALNIPSLISVNALAYSAGYLAIVTPSGAGVRESVMVFALTNALGYSIENAVVIALAARIVFILGELTGFVGYYLYYFLMKRNGEELSI
ncbi:flippase-like domain-containing protein [Candidatus Nomurabacteria bacterium]|uniref:Flippase-like domain-containing protein n=1 Tax=Candidatus Dojkabacteria bacterium TaxID=2099670 RepID=A0A955I1F5_9BACT|nr:flippase-like domain-containing protein [Candidatus Dojkabacteria bacterium]MCB9803337.1 flippase-like domain-containing protein [Candidatus Nomurabacteria bacterium]